MIRRLFPLAITVLLAFTTAGCKKDEPMTEHAGGKLLARVNSTTISDGDLAFWTGGAHGKSLGPELRAQILERLIDLELLYQKGLELGLNKDPDFLARRAKMKDNLKVFDRLQIKRLVVEKVITPKVNVPLETAQAYFDKHRSEIDSDWHLQSIRFPSEAAAEAALKEIRGGASFEDVAKRVAGSRAKGHARAPRWDLGFVPWKDIPPEWHEAVFKLKPNDVSEVVRSRKGGLRIVKLIATRPHHDVEFDEYADLIIQQLKTKGLEEAAEAYVAELRKAAKIKRFTDG